MNANVNNVTFFLYYPTRPVEYTVYVHYQLKKDHPNHEVLIQKY